MSALGLWPPVLTGPKLKTTARQSYQFCYAPVTQAAGMIGLGIVAYFIRA